MSTGQARWPASWDRIPELITAADAASLVASAPARLNEMLQGLDAVRGKYGLRRAMRLSRMVLNSETARLAVLTKLARKKKLLQPHGKLTNIELVGAAKATSPWKPTGEPIYREPKPRLNGKDRWVFSLGLRQQAMSQLSDRVARRMIALHPDQFLLQGSRRSLVDWLGTHLKSGEVVLTVDLPQCFDRISHASVKDGLPLPRRVMETGLFDVMSKSQVLLPSPKGIQVLKELPEHLVDMSSGKRGIPQGAALSGITSEAIISDLLHAIDAVAPTVHSGAYSDNLIVVMEDATCEQSVLTALASRVAKHFGQDAIPELMCRKQTTKKGQAFAYCGRVYRWTDNGLTTRVSEDRIENYRSRFSAALGDVQTAADYETAKRSLQGWFLQTPQNADVVNAFMEMTSELAEAKQFLKDKPTPK